MQGNLISRVLLQSVEKYARVLCVFIFLRVYVYHLRVMCWYVSMQVCVFVCVYIHIYYVCVCVCVCVYVVECFIAYMHHNCGKKKQPQVTSKFSFQR